MNSEGFKWFEATASGGQGSQRGAVAWADVRGAARVGQWNGCAAAAAARGCERVTLAARLLGVEMQHPGVEKDVTVLWCKNEVERDVGAAAARPVCAAPHVAAAGDGGRHQQPVPAQLDVMQAHALPTGQVQPPPACRHAQQGGAAGPVAAQRCIHATCCALAAALQP